MRCHSLKIKHFLTHSYYKTLGGYKLSYCGFKRKRKIILGCRELRTVIMGHIIAKPQTFAEFIDVILNQTVNYMIAMQG